MKQIDLTTGNITKKLWLFALPLMAGNVMQQFYNLADTWIVGKFVGSDALAAVGSSYTLMTFLTSVILGLCLGAGAFFSVAYGQKNENKIRNGKFVSLIMIGAISLLLAGLVLWQRMGIIRLLKVPQSLQVMMSTYLYYIAYGIFASFLYNYYASLLRGIGDSVTPLIFLGISVVMNIGLDLYFIISLKKGIAGAAVATTLSQYAAGVGIAVYSLIKYPRLRLKKADCTVTGTVVKDILSLSGLTCVQQSVMNFGILMVQGIVNTFGVAVMSAFAVAVKIDTVAYMPVQDFGNAYSTFVAQNYGARQSGRIREGTKKSAVSVAIFCVIISGAVFALAPELMKIFVSSDQGEIIAEGVRYLRIEGAFYIGIGILFMLYGYYRAVNKPMMSVVLTIISLGTRVLLAYMLSKTKLGAVGIWVSIPIGWFLADGAGIIYGTTNRRKAERSK